MKLSLATTAFALCLFSSSSNHNLLVVVHAQKTLAEIAQHATENDCWTAVGKTVYDLSGFTQSHNSQILVMCGKDGKR